MEKRRILLAFIFALSIASVGCGDDSGSPNEDVGDGENVFTNASAGNNGGPGDFASEAGGGGATQGETLPEPGQLTAGEWNDNESFDSWLGFLDQQVDGGGSSHGEVLLQTWGFAPTRRVHVSVTDANGPARDVPVRVLDAEDNVLGEGRSNHDGDAHVYVAITRDDEPVATTLEWGAAESRAIDLANDPQPISISLASPAAPQPNVDILFAIDVTGSMLDEQSYLQAELENVIQRVESNVSDAKVRTSINFYCDPEDDFTVRSNPFESDLSIAMAVLTDGASCSGQDYPEAVDEALEDAIDGHQWRESALARLVFLVLDAPGHTDQESIARLHSAQQAATAKGVRIIPILASGGDKSTEFMLRTLAASTGGTYVFITDDSGVGNDHLEPTVGEFEVEYLNELLERVITEFAAN